MAVAGLRGVECDTGDTDDSLTMELVRITRGRGRRVITTTGGLLMAESQSTHLAPRHPVCLTCLPGDLIRVIRGNQSDVKNAEPSSILTLSGLISEEWAWGTRGRVSASVCGLMSVIVERVKPRLWVLSDHHQRPGDSLHHHHQGDQRPAGERPVSPLRDQNCHFTFLKSLSLICQRSWPLIGSRSQDEL